jgi:LacI family transcriptional regulator
MNAPAPRKRILVCDVLGGGYGRRALLGIGKYASHHGRWLITHLPNVQGLEQVIRTWRPEGILVRGSDTAELAGALARQRMPVVEYDWRGEELDLPYASTDYAETGRICADFLLRLGHRSFGAYGSGHPDTIRIFECFEARIREAGADAHCLLLAYKGPKGVRQWSLERKIEELREWLASLTLPAAVLVGSDAMAVRVVEACSLLELRIPEDIALLGIGNDETTCQILWPHLSSVALNAERVGWESARMLDEILSGTPHPENGIVPPLGIVERASTDIIATEDESVRDALRLMRERCPEPLTVEEIAQSTGLCRRSLEKRFKKEMNCSPAEEMRRLRMAFAKDLLLNSDQKITSIAYSCHYRTFSDFNRNFKQETGMTPSEFRKRGLVSDGS